MSVMGRLSPVRFADESKSSAAGAAASLGGRRRRIRPLLRRRDEGLLVPLLFRLRGRQDEGRGFSLDLEEEARRQARLAAAVLGARLHARDRQLPLRARDADIHESALLLDRIL